MFIIKNVELFVMHHWLGITIWPELQLLLQTHALYLIPEMVMVRVYMHQLGLVRPSLPFIVGLTKRLTQDGTVERQPVAISKLDIILKLSHSIQLTWDVHQFAAN